MTGKRSLGIGLFCALWTCAMANAAAGPGTGTIELRIQTSSSVVGGGIIGTILPTGITYETQGKEWLLNLGAGAAYFVSPQFAVGGDVSFTLISNSETISIFTLAPFAKYVTGLAEHQIGFFVEPSVGFSFLHESLGSFGSDNSTLIWPCGTRHISGSPQAIHSSSTVAARAN